MIKKIIFIFKFFPSLVFALSEPNVISKNVVIYDITDDEILYEKNMMDKVNIASLTKIMTTITAIETINDIDRKIIITEDMLKLVRWDASIAGLKVGDELSYKDLLYASILPSGADATIAIAVSSCGSIEKFVEKMNDLARRIGMNNSNFVNVTGLDEDNHYSNVNDILTLLKYSLKNELFKEIYTTSEYYLSNGMLVRSTISSYNKKLNIDTSRILGSKTGYTLGAKLCISVYFESDGHEMILITLGADRINGKPYNIIDAMELISYVDDNYNNYEIVHKDMVVKEIEVLDSKISKYLVRTNDNVTLFLPIDYDKNKVTIEYEGLDSLSYKNKVNDKIGIIKYYYGDELIRSDDVLLGQDIKIDYFKVIYRYKVLIFVIIVLFIVIVGRRFVK